MNINLIQIGIVDAINFRTENSSSDWMDRFYFSDAHIWISFILWVSCNDYFLMLLFCFWCLPIELAMYWLGVCVCVCVKEPKSNSFDLIVINLTQMNECDNLIIVLICCCVLRFGIGFFSCKWKKMNDPFSNVNKIRVSIPR